MRATEEIDEGSAYTPKFRRRGDVRPDPFYYVVMGQGLFPVDMLRFDYAWAMTGMNRPEGEKQTMRSVIVASWQNELTNARWNSFGWGVVEKLDKKPEFLP